MKFRLLGKADWQRIRDHVAGLPFLREGKQVCYQVTVEEIDQAKTEAQNAAQFAWYTEAAKQHREMDAEGYRAYCKLHFGVPILRNANAQYRDVYDRIIRPMPYEQKLEMMRSPIDFPVTRGMNRKQLSEFLDAAYQHLSGLGVRLEDRAA